ncbi:FHA domain-containing protein [Mucilaginibacter myungsuensis]|uniref:FHA domain-containing protein n=1 Tax=Mucilaginibacter myungsuensis TaxID=649104 RepID=A0A929L011_9SPHI|nr:FHA domain-containing protein [Mucilaginibacter myungsuensis]MBE9663715.1 FHA domain-containing protein [Mucilaginibacter myungsuensis]MDN3598961.1 FHA domain-containing protein [Mucilaginibacter myungsuensis]
MFNIFGQSKDKPNDVKGVRDALLRALKEHLQKAEGGEGRNIKGINLFITAPTADKHLYESAVHHNEPELFRDEIQRIADDYDIGLPLTWELEVVFTDEVPSEAIPLNEVDAAIFIRTKAHVIQRTGSAYIRVLNGKAEQNEYTITSEDGKLNIGREAKAQIDGGFYRINQIAFPSDTGNDANRYISRQHAHIEWNNDKGCFMLFADEGGIPPGNKVKVRIAANETLIKLHSSLIGHQLAEGDQIILGETAVIEFSYKGGIING